MPREIRHIIRVADTDLDGTKEVAYALTSIKGVGPSLARAIVQKAGVNPEKRVGFLSDAEIGRIEDVIRDPSRYGIPSWLLNRRKDLETGKDRHLIGSDLVLQTKMDIDRMKAMKAWRGFRHAWGLKVRGQRTRTTGRTKKAMVVKKKRRTS